MATYECKKCYKTIQSSSTPMMGTCSKGGAHNWHKLASRAVKWLFDWV